MSAFESVSATGKTALLCVWSAYQIHAQGPYKPSELQATQKNAQEHQDANSANALKRKELYACNMHQLHADRIIKLTL